MSEGLVLQTAKEELVLPTSRDKMIAKINELKKAQMTFKEKERYGRILWCYTSTFHCLAKRYFGLTKDLIRNEFDREMFVELEAAVYKKALAAHWRAKFLWIPLGFLAIIPGIGMVLLANTYYANDPIFIASKFVHAKKALNKMIGEGCNSILLKEYFPDPA